MRAAAVGFGDNAPTGPGEVGTARERAIGPVDRVLQGFGRDAPVAADQPDPGFEAALRTGIGQRPPLPGAGGAGTAGVGRTQPRQLVGRDRAALQRGVDDTDGGVAVAGDDDVAQGAARCGEPDAPVQRDLARMRSPIMPVQ
ncbi:hypothetical protein GCM10027570_31300 [Streptomonospora sediminis]